MTTQRSLALLAVLVSVTGMTGCAVNAATFYEGTRFALAGEYNPASGQPVNFSLGYKRRIAAIVAPQEASRPATSQDRSPIPSGEALSLVSLFDVGPGGPNFGDGVIIKSAFASGVAAQELTRDPSKAEANIRGLFAKETVPALSRADTALKDALLKDLKARESRDRKVAETQAQQILQIAGVRLDPPADCPTDRKAICALQDALSGSDEARLRRFEDAFAKVPAAPAN